MKSSDESLESLISKKRIKQEQNTKLHKRRRASIPKSEVAAIQLKDTLHHKETKAGLSEEARAAMQLKNTFQQQVARSEVTEEERSAMQLKDTLHHRENKAGLSEEARAKNTLQQQVARVTAAETAAELLHQDLAELTSSVLLLSNYADEVWLLTRPQGFNVFSVTLSFTHSVHYGKRTYVYAVSCLRRVLSLLRTTYSVIFYVEVTY